MERRNNSYDTLFRLPVFGKCPPPFAFHPHTTHLADFVGALRTACLLFFYNTELETQNISVCKKPTLPVAFPAAWAFSVILLVVQLFIGLLSKNQFL